MKNKFTIRFSLLGLFMMIIWGAKAQDEVVTASEDFPWTSVHSIDGVGWATPIATSLSTDNIFWAYIDPDLNAVIAKKQPDGTITSHIVQTNVPKDENHAELSIGLDNDGYIHYIGGQHNNSPNYYVSKNPEDITSWEFRGADYTNGGLQGTKITYQAFYRSNNGTLFCAYRNNLPTGGATSGMRTIALGRYDTSTKKWTMIGGQDYCVENTRSCELECGGTDYEEIAFIWNHSGVGDMSHKSETECFSHAHYQGYQLKVLFDHNNGMHVTYNMADSINTSYTSGDPSKSMTHVFYAFSPDEGDTWYKADGSQITSFPITKAAGDLVYERYPEGYTYPDEYNKKSMANTNFMVLDSNGKPLIIQDIFVSGTRVSQVFKWNGSVWENVTSQINLKSFNLYSNHNRKEMYTLDDKFWISNDDMQTRTLYDVMENVPFVTSIDRYYLKKKNKIRYYATGSGVAKIVTISITDSNTEPQDYTLTTSVNGSGTITLNPTGGTYSSGTTVTATANPSDGYKFDNWSGASTATTTSVDILMDANKTLTANFSATNTSTEYTLSTSVNGNGSITLNPSGGTYADGTTVTATAIADDGYQFDGWSGASTATTLSVDILMDSDKTLTATFSASSSDNNGVLLQAENYDAQYQVNETTSTYIAAGHQDWVRFDNVDLGSGYSEIKVRYSKGNTANSKIEVRLGSTTGTKIADISLEPTGSWDTYTTTTVSLNGGTGTNSVYFIFYEGWKSGYFDYFEFTGGNGDSEPEPEPEPVDLVLLQAETYDGQFEVNETTTTYVVAGDKDWIRFDNVDLGTGFSKINVRYSKGNTSTSKIEVRLGSTTGTKIAEISLSPTGGWDTYTTTSATVNGGTGVQTLYFIFSVSWKSGYFDWFEFNNGTCSSCRTTSSIENELIDQQETVNDRSSSIRVYPNPVIDNKKITIQLSGVEKTTAAQLKVFSFNGKLIYNTNLVANDQNMIMHEIEASSLSGKGLYFISVSTFETVYNSKIIIH